MVYKQNMLFILRFFKNNTLKCKKYVCIAIYMHLSKNQSSAQFKYIYIYAPKEEKTWTVHISCKLPPEPKAMVANTRCGLAHFTPVESILFFLTPRPKMTHFRFCDRRDGILLARCEEK